MARILQYSLSKTLYAWPLSGSIIPHRELGVSHLASDLTLQHLVILFMEASTPSIIGMGPGLFAPLSLRICVYLSYVITVGKARL